MLIVPYPIQIIEHPTTTPVHPQSNGLIEGFGKSIKELIQKAVINVPSRWESVLKGMHIRMPLQKAICISNDQTLGNRPNELARVLKIARVMTEDSRKHNRERFARKSNDRQILPGDSLIIKSEARVTLTSRWDPHLTITRVRGPLVSLHHQQTYKTRVLSAEQFRIVNPEPNWDPCNPRPIRHQIPSTDDWLLCWLPTLTATTDRITLTQALIKFETVPLCGLVCLCVDR